MKRGGPIARKSAKRAAAGPAERVAVAEMNLREGDRCQGRLIVPHDRCSHGVDPHHVWRQSKGGPWQAWNLIGLCRVCHSWVHDHPLLSESYGLLVPSWTCYRGCMAAAALRAAPGLHLAPWLTPDEIAETVRQDPDLADATILPEWFNDG